MRRLAYLSTFLRFLLPTFDDVALAAALGGEPPRRLAAARPPFRPLDLAH
jgi:hypothetical protein